MSPARVTSPLAAHLPPPAHDVSAISAEPRMLVERHTRLMATDISIHIAVAPGDEAAAHSAADACLAWLAAVDAHLSRFRPESELCRLNACGGAWFRASDLLYRAVERALWAARVSEGRFDPTILPLLEAAGYDCDFSLIADRVHTPSPIPAWTPGRWRDITLDDTNRRIRLPQNTRIDLGGIAKGWAADVALDRYCASFPGALVDVGGDLRLRGRPHPDHLWAIGLRDPRAERQPSNDSSASSAPSFPVTLFLSRGGVATSGAVRRWWLRDGRPQHHVIDPSTGRPADLWLDHGHTPDASRVATATAIAATAAQAEVAAKVALLRGHPAAIHAVDHSWQRHGASAPTESADAGVALVLLLGSGEVVCSANIHEILSTLGTDGASLPVRVAGVAPHGT